MLMQVRYADTPAQKELKRITAERRQFRTNEYNIGAYGTADVGIHPSIYSPAPWNRRPDLGTNGYVSFCAAVGWDLRLTYDQPIRTPRAFHPYQLGKQRECRLYYGPERGTHPQV